MESLQRSDVPLPSSKQEDLRRFAESLSREQLLWASGYLTGVGNTIHVQGIS